MKNYKIALLIASFLSSTALGTTLSEALINTYQNNPELISAREKLKATDEQMYKAISTFLPSINYTAKKAYSRDDTTTFTNTNSSNFNTTIKTQSWDTIKTRSTELRLDQNVFNGGRSVMAVQIAKYTINSGRAELLSTEQTVLGNAIQAFLQVVYTKNVLEINKENILAYEKQYETIKERVLAGVDKQSDLAKTAADRANAYTDLTSASGDYEQALAAYVKQTGLDAENLIDETLGTIPKNQMEVLNKSLVANPDLLNVNCQQKAADINVVANAAALLPTVNLGGTIGKNWQQQSANTIGQPWTNTKSIFFQVSVPIFNRGIEFSNTREAKAGAARLKYVVKNAKASVIQGSSQVWTDYVTRKESIVSSEEAVKSATIALEGMQQAYDEGVSSLTDLLEAQQILFHYKIRLARVKFDAENSRYAILALMGQLNAKDLHLQTKIYNPASNYDKIKFEIVGF